jgi:hypothetical protein
MYSYSGNRINKPKKILQVPQKLPPKFLKKEGLTY